MCVISGWIQQLRIERKKKEKSTNNFNKSSEERDKQKK